MPSATDGVDVPSDAAAAARRYRRLERPLSGAVALLVGAAVAASLVLLPVVQALLASLTVVALVRFPVFRSSGTAELVTEAPPEAVRDDFTGPTPPILAFQWGPADSVRSTPDGSRYDVSYLFGLRSVSTRTEVLGPSDSEESADELELVVTTGGRPWATYAVSILRSGDETRVDVEWTSDRRFGLRRLPQWLVAERYREAALRAQGYDVARRDASLSL
jgi:hypothetical protein